jgi:hypothetical protein
MIFQYFGLLLLVHQCNAQDIELLDTLEVNSKSGDGFGRSVSTSGNTIVVGAFGEERTDEPANSGAAYVFVRVGNTWTQQAYLKASNPGVLDEFGTSVSISGDTIVVGAIGERSSATGVNGDQSNDDARDSGAAYVFVRVGNTWTQQAYLKASNTGAGDYFGISVSISGDTIVVGAYLEDSNAVGVNGDQSNDDARESGAAYVFVRVGNSWTQQAYLKASNTEASDNFGCPVSISGDTIVVGAIGEDSNAKGANRDPNNNGAFQSGAAYVFVRNGNSWTQQAYLKASNTEAEDQFGYAVSISGNTIVVSSYGESSNAIGVNGNQDDNSAIQSGAAYVFVRDGTTWAQQAYLKASNTEAYDIFGSAVSISGDTIVVGAFWEASNATGVNGDQNNNDAFRSGAAYVFVRNGTDWTQQAYLKSGRVHSSGYFGGAVAINDSIVVGQYDANLATVFGTKIIEVVTSTSTSAVSIDEASSEDISVVIVAVVVPLVVLVIVGVVIGLLLFRRKRNNADNTHNSGSVSLTLQTKSMLQDIKIEELLGSGNFGKWFLDFSMNKND